MKIEESPLYKKNVTLNSLKMSRLGNGVAVQNFTLTCRRAALKAKKTIKQ